VHRRQNLPVILRTCTFTAPGAQPIRRRHIGDAVRATIARRRAHVGEKALGEKAHPGASAARTWVI
jgi:hypothetical protein